LSVGTMFLSADKRLVHLERPREPVPAWADHGAPERMHRHPAPLVPVESELALEPERTDSRPPDISKPAFCGFVQSDMHDSRNLRGRDRDEVAHPNPSAFSAHRYSYTWI
jgi:hypothetical protein